MYVRLFFVFAYFLMFIVLSKEVPIKGSTLAPDEDLSHIEATEKKSDDQKINLSGLGRTNHSRMLTLSTTLAYDEWWIYTTKKPPFLYKDFPGRPGVATWREISSGGSSEESGKSRTKTSPTAAGVSSGSKSITSNYHYTHIIWVLFISLCFYSI